MKFHKLYNGIQETYRIDPEGFINPFNYLSPEFERVLKNRYFRLPKYNPHIKRLNTPEIAGYTPIIKNY